VSLGMGRQTIRSGIFASILLTAAALATHGQAASQSPEQASGQSSSSPPQKPEPSPPSFLSPPSQGGDLLLNKNDVDRNIWANARTYVDLPVKEIQAKVEELQGLEPESSQDGLSSLLERVGESSIDLLHHTPNVASREEQITDQRRVSQISQGAMGSPLMGTPTRDRQEFGYLLLSHTMDGVVELREYRTDKNGQPLESSRSRNGQMTEGFASEWLRLLPGNRHESRFRYLGRQEVDKRKTLVLAFAQIPEEVKSPGRFSFDGIQVSVLVQGLVWVDASNFHIVKMREDLLAPRPDVYLKEVTTRIRFAEVPMEKAGTSLWLPVEAAISWNCKGVAVEQRHIYSDYRLYAVRTKIIPQ